MSTNHQNQAVLEAFRFRHACKRFDPTKTISKEDFDTILEAARLSPSSFGFEPWKIIVLSDKAIQQKLYPLAWGARNSLDGASHFVILLARKREDTLYSSDYITHVMREIQQLPQDVADQRREKFRAFEADDFELLESDRALFDWASKQTYIMLANMMTAAALLGIDSCPIEGFHRRSVDELLVSEGLFDPAHFGVSVMVSFGYRAEPPKREKTRQSIEELVIWR